MGMFSLPRLRYLELNKNVGKVSLNEFAVRAGYNPLEDFQMDQYNFIYRGTKDARMLMGCRGTGKSVTCSIIGAAYEIYLNNDFTVAIVTKEAKRSAELVRSIGQALEANGVILVENSGMKINVSGKSQGINQANVKGLAMGGRGFRGLHPDLIILDDPVTEIDAWSATERMRVKDKYDEIMKLNSNVAIIGQPVSNKDLYLTLWDIIPTMKQTWDMIPNKFFGTIYKPDLEKLRMTVSEKTIQMSYFLNVPDDPSLAYAKIETVDYMAHDNLMFIDPSAGKGDFTGISIGGVFMGTGKFITLGFMFQEAWFDLLPTIEMLIRKFNVRGLYVETNGVGAGMPDMLARAGIPCTPINSTENKHRKIISFADQVSNMGLYKLSSSVINDGGLLEANENFIQNVKDYTYDAKHDDGIDSMVSLIKHGYGLRNDNRT